MTDLVQHLWRLMPEDFNEWRATNDLPRLRVFLEERLPEFRTWMFQFGITENCFCRVVPTGALFVGDSRRIIYRNNSFYPNRELYSVLETSKQEHADAYRRRGETPPNVTEFEPYFAWAKRTLKGRRFFPSRAGEPPHLETFEFTSWTAFDKPMASRETLLGSYELVKIGATVVTDLMPINAKNLDFADLDFLRIEGGLHGSAQQMISFSTCKRWTIEGADLNFWTFHRCDLQESRFNETQLYKCSFSRSKGFNVQFARCRLRYVQFDRSGIPLDFNQCDLVDVKFIACDSSALSNADQYRRLRTALQGNGRREEASRAYYQERLWRQKALWAPYLEYRDLFPAGRYGGRLTDILRLLERKQLTRKQAITFALSVPLFHVRVWLHPKYAWRALLFKAKFLVSCLEWAVWGYGERPGRVFGTAVAIILVYASVYVHFADALATYEGGNRFVKALYFSIVTFTTLGYGDVLPKTDLLRMVCGSEAVLGGFTMGLVVAGFANRSRY
jgi:hypothetical protein